MDFDRVDKDLRELGSSISRPSHFCLAPSSESVLKIVELQEVLVKIEKIGSGIVNNGNGNRIIQGRLQVQMPVEDEGNRSLRNGGNALQGEQN